MNILSRWQTLFSRRYVISHLLLGIVAASVAGLPISNGHRLSTPFSDNLFCLIYSQTQRTSRVTHPKSHYSHINQTFYLKIHGVCKIAQSVLSVYLWLCVLFSVGLSIMIWLTKLLGTRSGPRKYNLNYYS